MKSSKRIFFIYFIIQIIIAIILYPLLPNILNYPPDSINNDFQLSLGEMYYTTQYVLLFFTIVLINSLVLIIQLKKIESTIKKLINKPTVAVMDKVKYLCLYTPYLVFYLEICGPLILLPILFLVLGATKITIIKICIVYVSAFTIVSIVSFVFSKKEFKRILIFLSEKYSKLYNSGKIPTSKIWPNSLRTSLLQYFIPLIFLILTLVSLITYTQTTKEIGNISYNHYIVQLNTIFKEKKYSYEELTNNLKKIILLDETHKYFVISEDSTYLTSDNSNLSEFFIKYTLNKSESQNGRIYDYYGIDFEGTCIKVLVDSNYYYVGACYNTSNYNLFNLLIIISLLFFVLSLIIIFYVVTSLVKDIQMISKNFENIVHHKTNINKLALTSNDEIKNLAIAFNEIQDMTMQNIEQIKSNQNMLMEQERLASLGQMIGGIAHNLKTPIMSISGATEGLKDLTKEYDISIGDPQVTNEDHHAIVKDMNEWIKKIQTHASYMSDVITAVKGQAVAFSDTSNDTFTISELLTHIDVLMKHELKNALIELNTSVLVPDTLSIKGNVNSLVQVINNIISNAIQAYNGKPNKNIDFVIKVKNHNIIFTIQDYGCGMSKKVQAQLFKNMITTKGKNGTGLGLFMSYSNIKAHFNGDITFESEEGKGTKFNIILPLE